tara:strand:- start:406 stop:561 length:156 start_codon:yes stop_codon:yes gene_type:complete
MVMLSRALPLAQGGVALCRQQSVTPQLDRYRQIVARAAHKGVANTPINHSR